jgi:ribosomal protein S3
VTDDSAFKAQVRARMARTGEKYTEARREVIAEQQQDAAIRDVIQRAVDRATGIAAVSIERPSWGVRVDIHSSRPAVWIGRRGEEADRIRGEMEELTGGRVQLNIFEVREVPEAREAPGPGEAGQGTTQAWVNGVMVPQDPDT